MGDSIKAMVTKTKGITEQVARPQQSIVKSNTTDASNDKDETTNAAVTEEKKPPIKSNTWNTKKVRKNKAERHHEKH